MTCTRPPGSADTPPLEGAPTAPSRLPVELPLLSAAGFPQPPMRLADPLLQPSATFHPSGRHSSPLAWGCLGFVPQRDSKLPEEARVCRPVLQNAAACTRTPVGDIWLVVDVPAVHHSTEKTWGPECSLEPDRTFQAACRAVSLSGRGLVGAAGTPGTGHPLRISPYQGDREAKPKARKQAGREGLQRSPHPQGRAHSCRFFNLLTRTGQIPAARPGPG